MNEYLIADTHFGHKNILNYTGRPFSSIEEHDQALINNWNQVVSEGDIIYHLGDFALCGPEREREITKQLKGVKYLILGNHDRRSNTRYKELGFEPLNRLERDCLIFTHKPLVEVPEGMINVHGHTHDTPHPELTRHICVSVEMIGYKPIKLKETVNQYEQSKQAI